MLKMKTGSRKLLIVKPPYAYFPLGMTYVLSCLERHGIPFDFIDTALTNPNYSKLIRKNDYLAFAIGGLISNFKFISQTLMEIRSLKPDLPIILGGNITKDANQEFLFNRQMMGIDFGIIGEAETSLPYLIEMLNGRSVDIKKIPGLLFKDVSSGIIVKNRPQRLDLESANILPAWHKINMNYYKTKQVSYMRSQKCFPVLTGRGCVGICTFCSPTVGWFRERPIEHVMEEIGILTSNYDFEILRFINEVFYPTKEGILKFCEQYKRLKIKKPWTCTLRVDVKGMDDETFIAMKDAGCILTSAGIESGSNKILKRMRKQTTKEQVVSFFNGVRKAKMSSTGQFMIGNEGETEDDIKETIDMVIKEGMNADASLTNAYPGTQVYKNALNKGLIKNEKEHYEKGEDSPAIYSYWWKNRKMYLNITEIPENDFWRVIVNETRRFYSFLYKRFRLLNVKYKINFLTQTVKATGICSECNSLTKISSFFDLLGQVTFCPKCYHRLSLNYYELPWLAKHFETLCNELKNANKLIVVGVEQQAMNVLRYDHFGLDYNKIQGSLDLKANKDCNYPFVYLPVLKIDDLAKIQPDTILVADDPHGDAEIKLKSFYSKNKLEYPNILHLISDKRTLLILFRLKSSLKTIFGASFIRKVGKFILKHELR